MSDQVHHGQVCMAQWKRYIDISQVVAPTWLFNKKCGYWGKKDQGCRCKKK